MSYFFYLLLFAFLSFLFIKGGDVAARRARYARYYTYQQRQRLFTWAVVFYFSGAIFGLTSLSYAFAWSLQ